MVCIARSPQIQYHGGTQRIARKATGSFVYVCEVFRLYITIEQDTVCLPPSSRLNVHLRLGGFWRYDTFVAAGRWNRCGGSWLS